MNFWEVPELLAIVLLSLPTRNRNFQWLMRIKRVSKHFQNVIQENVVPLIKILPKGIMNTISENRFRDYKKITTLDLSKYPMKKSFLPLSNIKELLFREENLDWSFLSQMSQLVSFRCIQFIQARVKDYIPPMTNLTKLDLYNTDVTNNELLKLPHLKKLHSDACPGISYEILNTSRQITDISIGAINDEHRLSHSNSPQLTSIRLYSDTHLAPNTKLADFNNLSTLILYQKVDLAGIGKLTQLTSLSLKFPENNESFYQEVPKLTNLESLVILSSRMRNMVIDRIFQHRTLQKLEFLSLTSVSMNDDSLKNLDSLKTLHLFEVDEITNTSISCLTNLTSLEICLCLGISYACLPPLVFLTNLYIGATDFVDSRLLESSRLVTLRIDNVSMNVAKNLLELPNLDQLICGKWVDSTEEFRETKSLFWKNGIYL